MANWSFPVSKAPAVREFLDHLAASSRYSFSTGEALKALGISQTAWYMALSRLTHQKRVASPARGFHVIVPPEYRALACLPADQFIPDLMKRLKLRYYVGLLTAAPEATAIDLVGYPRHAGGFSQVTTVLAELAERIDPKKLAQAAEAAPVPWLQRLGHVLDHVGAADKTLALSAFVRKHAHEPVPLVPGAQYGKSSRDSQWRVYVNAKVEADL
jgi:predicted transcriptional regulator of viral defense system